MTLLDAYAIPVATTYYAADADEAGQLAALLNQPVVLKIAAPDIIHKAGSGGMVLDLQGHEQVRLAALGMQADIAQRFPKARLQGFNVQPMVHWPQAYELMLGMFSDPLFGPVLIRAF
jgi:acetyltransferase